MNWILASERLPIINEKLPLYGQYKHCICTVYNNQVIALDYVRKIIRGKIVFRWECNGRISPWEPIAWMPFPEPYKMDI